MVGAPFIELANCTDTAVHSGSTPGHQLPVANCGNRPGLLRRQMMRIKRGLLADNVQFAGPDQHQAPTIDASTALGKHCDKLCRLYIPGLLEESTEARRRIIGFELARVADLLVFCSHAHVTTPYGSVLPTRCGFGFGLGCPRPAVRRSGIFWLPVLLPELKQRAREGAL